MTPLIQMILGIRPSHFPYSTLKPEKNLETRLLQLQLHGHSSCAHFNMLQLIGYVTGSVNQSIKFYLHQPTVANYNAVVSQ